MMMNDAQRAMIRTHGVLVGRILLGLLFLVAGINKFMGGVDGFAAGLEGMGLPLPALLAWVVILLEVIGGAFLILGYRVGQASAALSIFLILTIIVVHNPLKDTAQLTAALKNLSIMGGLLYVMAFGAGDGWKLCKTTSPQM